jgi:type VI secretion system secreted protein Hcp
MADGERSSSIKFDGFLKVPDIPGPSEREGHEEEIEIHGVNFKMQAPHDPNNLSLRGRVEFGAIVFTKYYDMSSPYLKKALFDNTEFDEVSFFAARRVKGEFVNYLEVVLTKASIMSYKMRPGEEEPDKIEEDIGFAYHAIKFIYDKDHEIEMSVRVG